MSCFVTDLFPMSQFKNVFIQNTGLVGSMKMCMMEVIYQVVISKVRCMAKQDENEGVVGQEIVTIINTWFASVDVRGSVV